MTFRHTLVGAVCAAWLVAPSPAAASDLGYAPPPPSGFSFTPYGWMINVNGDVTARENRCIPLSVTAPCRRL
jgi:hypothetical protein